MLGVNHAYVTAIGRLIGVVGLKELRWGIENANSGHLAKTAALMAAQTAFHSAAAMQSGKCFYVIINDWRGSNKLCQCFSPLLNGNIYYFQNTKHLK